MNPYDEKELVTAKRFWDWSYGQGGDERKAFQVACGFIGKNRPDTGSHTTTDLMSARYLHWSALWAEHGYLRLVTSHRYAASLMCTEIRRENVEDIVLPSKAFVVSVPNGLLRHPSGIELNRIYVGAFTVPGDNGYLALASSDKPGLFMAIHSPEGGLAGALFQDVTHVKDGEENTHEFSSAQERLRVLARRLVVGLMFSMQHTNNWRALGTGGGTSKSRGAPKHRVVMVSSPLAIDCRPAVEAFLSGETGTAPSVQTLVRGHYKRQVVGVSRSGRKVIWVEPYWRGPEDAPILARPYHVGPPQAPT